MLDKESILKTIREHRPEIQKFGIKRLALFGSFAAGKQTASSDLDFAVEFEHKTFDAYMGLKQLLEEIFGRQVDLVLFDTIKPRLKPQIFRDIVDAA